MNVNNILIALLLAVVITILALIYKNMIDNENKRNKHMKNLKNMIKKNPEKNVLEGFQDNNSNSNANNSNNTAENVEENAHEDLKEEHDKLKKYMKIHGLYPQNQGVDMTKYVLKSTVKSDTVCPDMSQYILKSSVPPTQQCPQINRDEWIRKTELPPNWNKECPAHPDLTNYVLKSTIPSKQDCPACICPKVKVNAGLCREPSKEECLKNTEVIKEACPKPEPCPEPVCPPQQPCPEPDPTVWIKRSELPPDWNKKCPPPKECSPCPRPPPPPKCPETTCPPCPKPKQKGDCPAPERCPPAQNCPKCYDVKYIKVPVVKSEPLPKPNKETIFPTNIIDTKLVRQQMPEKPRQPRVLRVENEMRNNRNNRNNNNRNNNIKNEEIVNNEVEEGDEEIETKVEEEVEEQFLAPSDVALNNTSLNMAPVMSPKLEKPKNLFNKTVEKIKEVISPEKPKQNRKYPKEMEAKCEKAELNKMFDKFGTHGFNNQL